MPPPPPPRVKPGYLVQLVDGAGNVISQTDGGAATTRAIAANAATAGTAAGAAVVPSLPALSPPSLRNRGAVGGVQIKEEPQVYLPPSTATKKKAGAGAAGGGSTTNTTTTTTTTTTSKMNKGMGPGGKRKLKDILALSLIHI